MLDKMTADFFLHSYFKIKPNDNCDAVINKLVEKAYIDATVRGAFNALIPKEAIDLRKRANDCALFAKIEMACALQSFAGKNYRKWHKYLCRYLVNWYSLNDVCYSGKDLWSYGNSQKLVNMSVKYLLIVGELFKQFYPNSKIISYSDKFLSILQELDIPVDTYVLEAMIKSNSYKFNNAIVTVKKQSISNKTMSVSELHPWSTWDETQYESFREEYHKVFGNDVPLEWENENWIKYHP